MSRFENILRDDAGSAELDLLRRSQDAFRQPRIVQTNLTNEQFRKFGFDVIEVDISHLLSSSVIESKRWGDKYKLLYLAEHHSDPEKNAWRSEWVQRVSDLRQMAAEEDIEVSDYSISSAEKFIDSLPSVSMPSTFLLDNGNIRLVWVNETGEQIGLQFRSSTEVQYVLLKVRDGMSVHSMGVDVLGSVTQIIRSLGLFHVMANSNERIC